MDSFGRPVAAKFASPQELGLAHCHHSGVYLSGSGAASNVQANKQGQQARGKTGVLLFEILIEPASDFYPDAGSSYFSGWSVTPPAFYKPTKVGRPSFSSSQARMRKACLPCAFAELEGNA